MLASDMIIGPRKEIFTIWKKIDREQGDRG